MRRALRLVVVPVAMVGLVAVVHPAWAGDDHRTWVVSPGESIQRAVDQAQPGDTIKIEEGVFHEAVCAWTKGLTIVGAGRDKTIIAAPATFSRTACWETAADVSAFAWYHPSGGVTVGDLSTEGHPASSIFGVGVHGFTVEHHTGTGHGEYGVAAFQSTRITIVDNVEKGDGGEAGIYVGDTADAAAHVARNESSGWSVGIFLRDSRNGEVARNTTSGNCIGALVLDTGPNGQDQQTGQVNHKAGDWVVGENEVVDNDRACPPSEAPPLSGHGIVVVGADRVLITKNLISDNNASGDSFLPPSGLTVVSGTQFGGVPEEKIEAVDNTFKRNDLDIYWDGQGREIVFAGNDCSSSTPASICG